jgi:hypothetical protein
MWNSIRGVWSALRNFLRDLLVITALGAAFYFLYNTTIPILGRSIRSFVAYGTSELLTLFASVAVALYAYKTVHEMMKDRRKDTVEKKLEKVYTPIYETLLGAREKGRSNHDPSTWDISVKEIEHIKDIMKEYGHYFRTREDLDTFRKTLLQKGKKEPTHGNSWLFQESDMGPVFEKVIEAEKEALIKEFRELTKPPGSSIDAEAHEATSPQEHTAQRPPKELASGVPHKSRLERFDEVFRTLLVIASVLTAFSLTSAPPTFLSGTFQFTLLLFAAIVIWSIAVLWGDHRGAHAARLASLQILSIHLLLLLMVLFLLIPPAVTSPVDLAKGMPLGIIIILDITTVTILGAIYLRLGRREVLFALFLGGCVMALWGSTMQVLYP